MFILKSELNGWYLVFIFIMVVVDVSAIKQKLTNVLVTRQSKLEEVQDSRASGASQWQVLPFSLHCTIRASLKLWNSMVKLC